MPVKFDRYADWVRQHNPIDQAVIVEIMQALFGDAAKLDTK